MCKYLNYQVLYTLAGHGKQHQEENVTGWMADELDEWFLDELPRLGVGGQHVHEAVVGEHDAELEDEEGLEDDVVPPEPRNSFVPDAS